MAAFRGRSFGRGLAVGCVEVWAMVEDFCASCSGRLTFDFSSCTVLLEESSLWSGTFGGRVSFTCGMPLAMDVSGTPEFRGGGGPESKVRG